MVPTNQRLLPGPVMASESRDVDVKGELPLAAVGGLVPQGLTPQVYVADVVVDVGVGGLVTQGVTPQEYDVVEVVVDVGVGGFVAHGVAPQSNVVVDVVPGREAASARTGPDAAHIARRSTTASAEKIAVAAVFG
jgi:hypothetical protein